MQPLVTVFVLMGWIISLALHEFGHAIVAYYGGDKSVKEKGYLTLNPLRYIDPLMSIVLPIIFLLMGGIGLPGGAVYIRRDLLKSHAWAAAVSAAGPLMTLLCAILLALPFRLGLVPHDTNNLLWPAVAFLAELEVIAFLLNLLPIPPLDGFGIITAWLPWETQLRVRAFGLYGLVLVYLVVSRAQFFWDTVYRMTDLLGIPPDMAYMGHRLFMFWQQH